MAAERSPGQDRRERSRGAGKSRRRAWGGDGSVVYSREEPGEEHSRKKTRDKPRKGSMKGAEGKEEADILHARERKTARPQDEEPAISCKRLLQATILWTCAPRRGGGKGRIGGRTEKGKAEERGQTGGSVTNKWGTVRRAKRK